MRTLRNLFLIAITTIATIALAAPAANAVEVSAEGGAHCAEVDVDNSHNVTGGCAVEAETISPAVLQEHVHPTGETILSICDNTFDARIHEAGDGWIFNQMLTGVNCGIEPCDEAETAPNPHVDYEWPATLMEFGPSEAIQVTFCIRPRDPLQEGQVFNTCTVFIPMSTPAPHTYRFTTLATGGHEPTETAGIASRCSQNAGVSLSGAWEIHGTPLEITH